MNFFYEQVPAILSTPTCVGLVAVLAYIPHLVRRSVVGAALQRRNKKYDVALSRFTVAQAMESKGDETDVATAQRVSVLTGAHLNGLEAFSLFAAACALAIAARVPRRTLDGAANAFVFLRLVYTVVYLTPALNGPLRSIVWFCATTVTATIFYFSSSAYDSTYHL